LTFESSHVEWQTDAITMHATVTRPLGNGPFPAAVFVAGSGPTDRDWNSPLLPGTNGSARLIAEELAGAGFASLRYDKRASGPHANESVGRMIGKMSMQSHLDELVDAVRTLASQSFVNRNKLFAVANSEGTLHALNYQASAPRIPLAGLVLIAPPGRAVGAVARSQLAAQAATLPNGDALMALYDQAITRFIAGEKAAPDAALPVGVQHLLSALESPANLPFARELWTTDSAPLLARIDVPTLIIIGKKDIQVDWQADGEPLQEAAAGRANITFLFPENANHVMKQEIRPRQELNGPQIVASYNGPDAKLDPEAMASITEWLANHA
jgi:pimeloyl-ACP methyl ester carboxylesterase